MLRYQGDDGGSLSNKWVEISDRLRLVDELNNSSTEPSGGGKNKPPKKRASPKPPKTHAKAASKPPCKAKK